MNQSFAYHSIIVWLCEVLFRVYTSYASLKKDQTKTIPSLTIVKNANASQNDKYKKPTYEN